VSEIGLPLAVGSRVVVTGMAGAGKSTFSRALSAKTGLPVICLDLHSWNPGWVRTPEDEFREKQRALLAGEKWIVDGNVALDLRFERADTLVFLDTPWWICARRAFVRGFRRPRESLSIVPRLTGLSRHRKVSVERRRCNSPLQRTTARFAGSSPLSSPSR
jgi:adenylate kinase family enzyme